MANKKSSKAQLTTTSSSSNDNDLSRREFLTGVGTVAFSAALTTLPQRAHAFGRFAFWKKNASASTSSNLWASSSLDPYWDYVALLMQFDGSNGATTFSDESNVGKTPTINGAPYIDTAASSSPYSGRTGSAYFNGSSTLSFAASTDWYFGTGDFTIEFWIKLASDQNGKWVLGLGQNYPAFAVNVAPGDAFSSTDQAVFQSSSNGSSWDVADISNSWGGGGGSWSINYNTWTHVAITRSGSTFRVFLNGAQVGTATSSTALPNNNQALYIGSASGSGSYLTGRLADLRIYKGLAKYTGNFTPRTTPQGLGSASDSNWGYCVLACPFENSLKDMSGKLATYSGTTTLATATKKFGTASASFNGTNSRVSVAQNTDFAFGSGDFTVELWVNFSSTSDSHVIGAHAWGTSSNWVLAYRSGQLVVNLNSSDYIAYTWTPTLTTWYHIAFTRSANNIQLFIGGALVGTASFSSSIGNSYPLTIGAPYNDTKYFSGYIDSFRITKGYARYVSNFTPPTAAFPVGKDEIADPFWNYTVLAMGMESVTDSTSRHSMTNNNSVGFNTTTYKYGTASASFNGSNTYISTPSSSDFSMSTGDYTAECWVRFAAAPSGDIGIFQTETNLSSSNGTLWIGYNSSKAWMGQHGTSNNVSGPWSPIAGVWYHFAASRQNGTGYVFINGVMLGSGSFNYTLTEAGAVAGKVTALNYLNGFIDDLRVTKGVARYVQNFTPPTRAFATTQYTTGSGSIVTSGLVCHVDAGNSSSYSGSGTAWSNLVSSPADGSAQSTYNLKLGDGSTSSTYPTFIGVANGVKANDYFSVDGGDFFCLSSSNTTFINSIHKAGANFTIEAWVYFTGATTRVHLGVTENYGTWGYGFWFEINSANKLVFGCINNSTTVFSKTSDNTVFKNAWNHIAISLTDGGTGFFYLNGSYFPAGSSSTWSSTYTSAGPTDASRALSLFGIQAAASTYADAGNRLAIWRMYNRALSKTELDQNWNATRARFGL